MGGIGKGFAEAPVSCGGLFPKAEDAAGKERGLEDYLGDYARKAEWDFQQLDRIGEKIQQSFCGGERKGLDPAAGVPGWMKREFKRISWSATKDTWGGK